MFQNCFRFHTLAPRRTYGEAGCIALSLGNWRANRLFQIDSLKSNLRFDRFSSVIASAIHPSGRFAVFPDRRTAPKGMCVFGTDNLTLPDSHTRMM